MTDSKPDAAQLAVLATQAAAPGEASLAEVSARVGRAVALAEPAGRNDEWAERFATWIGTAAFLPSVPILANAGRGGQLAACFVLEADDTIDSIYETLHRAARVQQGSGGVGIELSRLRPRGSPIATSGGQTPGPTGFAELFASSAHVMSLAGRRSGAHLAVLRDDHPDIADFVRAKRDDPGRYPALGSAVGVSDRFLDAAAQDGSWTLLHPRCAPVMISARQLLHEIAECVVACGEPTLLFIDRIEADNPTPDLGTLCATNPCGELPLLPDEGCVLGSLQLPAFLGADGMLDEDLLASAARDAVRFLDDAVEVNAWPDDGFRRAARRSRKIGLGVMGLADLLLRRDLDYGSREARGECERILGLVAREAARATAALADERGAFPAWKTGPRRRNATTRALAPTGTLSLIAGCSPGIEPFLAPRATVLTDAASIDWTDRWLVDWLARRTSDPKPVLDGLASGVPHRELPGLARVDQERLRRAWEIPPAAQLAMQASAQHHVDGGIARTIHLDPRDPPDPERVVAWIQRARALGCKGVAFYRRRAADLAAPIDLRRGCARASGV